MAANPELMMIICRKVSEREMLELIRNLSHLELKKFKKHEFAQMVLQDMSILLQNIEKNSYT